MKNRSKKQQGIVVLIILMVITLGAMTLLLSKLNTVELQIQNHDQTTQALVKAKEALIGYAVSDPNRPGELPCPDFNNDGIIIGSDDHNGTNHCQVRLGTVANPVGWIGWLPWRTLRLDDIRDGSGERLWYAVSHHFHANNSAPLNSNTTAQLSADGLNEVVAVIIAPGKLVGNQSNRPGSNDAGNDIGRFLEGNNVLIGDSSNGVFSTAPRSDPTQNDRILTITYRELMPLIERRAAGEIVKILNKYYTYYGFYPYPVPLPSSDCEPTIPTLSSSPNQALQGFLPVTDNDSNCPYALFPGFITPLWFRNNNWQEVMYYAIARACSDPSYPNCTNISQSVPFLTANLPSPASPITGVQALVIATGRPLVNTICASGGTYAAQTRPSTNLCDYLDSGANTDGGSTFEKYPSTTTYNDQTFVIINP